MFPTIASAHLVEIHKALKHRSGLALYLLLTAINLAVIAPSGALAQSCYSSMIQSPTPFMGNNGEVFKLADGSLWEVQYEYEYLYEYYPSVVICPGSGKLVVGHKSLNVRRLTASAIAPNSPAQSNRTPPVARSEIIESEIDGDFEGWSGDTIFKLRNGQIWQQVEYDYTYEYSYAPKVMIFRIGAHYEMHVEGVSERIAVKRLK